MVIPWAGYSLSKLLDVVEPTPDAKYVAFQTLLDPNADAEPDDRRVVVAYVEGLRLDEAMHPLALLAPAFMDRSFRLRTAPRSGSSRPGSTASRASSRS